MRLANGWRNWPRGRCRCTKGRSIPPCGRWRKVASWPAKWSRRFLARRGGITRSRPWANRHSRIGGLRGQAPSALWTLFWRPPMAASTSQLHPAIQKYLTALETKLRQTPGVAPEEGVADAHEFLQSECEAVWRRRPAVSDEDLYEHFVRKFGAPDDVAAAYAFASEHAEEGSPADDGRHAALDGTVSAAGHSQTPRPKSRVRSVLTGLGLVLVAVGLVAWSANSGLWKIAVGSAPQETLTWAD